MDNSLPLLHGYIRALFADIAPMYSKPSEVERDLTRLLHEVKYHGLEVLAVDLPALCKHFDKCLDVGLYTQSYLPYSRTSKKGVVVPALLQDLYLQVFTLEGCLRDHPSVNAILAIRQALKGLSKVKMPCSERRTSDEIDNFITIENSLPAPTLDWGSRWADFDDICHRLSDLSIEEVSSLDRRDGDMALCDNTHTISRISRDRHCFAVLQATADIISTSLGSFFSYRKEWSTEKRDFIPRHGKGRVSNQSKFVSKYEFTEWPSKLDDYFPFELYAVPSLGHGYLREEVPGDVQSPSQLIAVPKTLKGPRLIASEPNQMQFIQQLIMQRLYSDIPRNRFLRKAITFDSQEGNSSLALASSRSRSHSTIDLSSASDRLSLWLLERVLRRNPSLLACIHACRSETIRIRKEDNSSLRLKKAFSQGNALTFPMQSIVYSMVCAASILISRDIKVTARNVQRALSETKVYGDDMIVPIDSFETTTNLLEAVGFKVNESKTFHHGKFRESCGIDAYDGYIVTPSYVKNITSSPRHEHAVSTIEASNNLFSNGWWHLANWQMSLVKYASAYLPILQISQDDIDHPKEVSDETLSFKCFSGVTTSHLRRRYNSELHREEIQVYKLVSNSRKKQHSWGIQAFYQWIIENPGPNNIWSSGFSPVSSAVMRRGWIPDYYAVKSNLVSEYQGWISPSY